MNIQELKRYKETLKQQRHAQNPYSSAENWRQAHQNGLLSLVKAPWVDSKQIGIIRVPSIDPNAILPIRLGIEALLEEIGLDFRIVEFPLETVSTELVHRHVSLSGEYDTVSLGSILDKLDRECKVGVHRYQPTAVVVVVDKYFKDDKGLWGTAEYNSGRAFFALPKERQSSQDFLRRIAKHEATHLFGYGTHHDSNNVKGYPQEQSCNTLSTAPTLYTCQKCKDAVLYQWIGLHQKNNEKFLK